MIIPAFLRNLQVNRNGKKYCVSKKPEKNLSKINICYDYADYSHSMSCMKLRKIIRS